MFGFLYSKLDFIFFLYSILIFLIAKLSFINSKFKNENGFWRFLMFFSIFYGLRIVSDTVSLGGYHLHIVSTVFSSFAFLSLMEYARLNTKPIYSSKYWRWNTVIIGILGLATLIFLGEKSFAFFVRFGLCLLGGVWASIVLVLQTKKRNLFYGITLFLCALSLTHFVRLSQNVFSIWSKNNHIGLGLLLLGVVCSFGLLVTVNLYSNVNFKFSGIKTRNYLRYSVVFSLLVVTWFVTEQFSYNEQKNLENNLLRRAETAAAAINPARVKALTFDVKDEGKADFERLKEQLIEIKRVNSDLKFIYLVGVKEQQVVFYLDVEKKDSPDYAKPGDIWNDVPSAVKTVFSKGAVLVAGPYKDKWGTWKSAFVSIKDFKTHQTVAVLGMDVGVKAWDLNIMQSRLLGIVIGLSIFLCLLVLFIIYEFGEITSDSIKKSEAKFSAAFERSPVLTAISYLEDGRFIDVNETFCKVLGYSNKQEVIGKTSIELNMFRDYAERLNLVNNIKIDGFVDNFEMNIQTKTGGTIIGIYYGSVIELSGQKCLVSVIEDITQRKKEQSELKENEQYLRTMWESLQAGIAVVDAETFNVVDINEAALRILKANRQDVVGHNCGKYICSSDCHRCPVMFQGKEIQNRETFFKDSEGKMVPVLKTVEKIELKGRPYLLENFIEITKLKEAQRKLEESEVRFRDIATSMADWIWEANNDGVYTYCSGNVSKALGYTPEEIVGKKILDLTAKEDWEEIGKVVMEANKNKAPFRDVESRRIRKDGNQIIVRASGSPILDSEGNLLGYRGVEQDVTEKKKIEDEIRQLSRAVEQSPVTIVITDTEGSIEYANPKFTSLTGYTYQEAKGQNPRILKAGDMPPEHYNTLWNTIMAGYEWRGELHNKKKNGEFYWEAASISPIKDPNGKTTHFLAVKEDITDRKKLEAALQETQDALLRASKIKDEFLSITSHDLKSPLGIVKTSMSLLLDEKGLTPTIKEYAELSLRQSNKGLKLISDLLDLRKLETGDVRLDTTRFHFSRLVDEILQDFGKSYEQAGISLQSYSDGDYELNADYNKIGQLISNLLGNALKYTSRGGAVKVNTSLVQKQDLDKIMRDYLKVSISDTGAGIPEEKIKKIFEKYEQVSVADKKTGTGIGLAIAKYVCDLHHGDIWVESKIGQGSNFIFILPYEKEVQSVFYNEESNLPYKILIVDDMADQRFTTRALLKKSNFPCEEASNWKEALDKIRNSSFSLLLLDIEMPDINGYELLEIIRREKTPEKLPVIMYSSKPIDYDRCSTLGVSCFILKENAARDLVAQIRIALGIA